MSKLPRHQFWGAGEPDCPSDLKAPNGELHTMRCKVCGDGWRQSQDVCMAALGPPVPRYSGWLWTHVVKGGDYRMLGEAKLQTDRPLSDMAEVVVYQGADGKLWVRDAHEFRARFSRTRPDAYGVPVAAPAGTEGTVRERNLAMMIRILCSRRPDGTFTISEKKRDQALELLHSMGLQGSPLRGGDGVKVAHDQPLSPSPTDGSAKDNQALRTLSRLSDEMGEEL